jgi:hypothetical protein
MAQQCGFLLLCPPAASDDPGGLRESVSQLCSVLASIGRMFVDDGSSRDRRAQTREISDGGRALLANMRVRCLSKDVSWDRAAAAWEAALLSLVEG